jgi:hypothetical protein
VDRGTGWSQLKWLSYVVYYRCLRPKWESCYICSWFAHIAASHRMHFFLLWKIKPLSQ